MLRVRRAFALEKDPASPRVVGTARSDQDHSNAIAERLRATCECAWYVDVDPGSARTKSCAEQFGSGVWRQSQREATEKNRARIVSALRADDARPVVEP